MIELMGSYDIVTREVRSYSMTLTVFFHPNLIFTDAREQCRKITKTSKRAYAELRYRRNE